MVTAQLRMLIQDPSLGGNMNKIIEGFEPSHEDFFLDGPVSRRLAVLDFDPTSGALASAARWIGPAPGKTQGRYDVAQKTPITDPSFIQMNVFATVLRTIYLYEEPDALGRGVRWAFARPQLLIVPRAGLWANAFYERESRSLQFFFFDAEQGPVYTSLARDIVSHETGHAILDGIAPDLYHALTPQTLALHEAVADLTALMMGFRSRELRTSVLESTGGSILESNAFNALGEQFGSALDSSKRGYLRSLLNDLRLSSPEIDPVEPHDLSQVISGALYTLMVNLHQGEKQSLGFDKSRPDWLKVSIEALWRSAERFKRMVIRGLDYLPPGEVSFADYARAIISADQASFREDVGHVREALTNEFARREMVQAPSALEVETDFEHPSLKDLDLATLLESDWAAYHFANENRELLRIPKDIPFEVRPRLDVRKKNFLGPKKSDFQWECLFKVAWRHIEPNPNKVGDADERAIKVGTTLVIDQDTKRARARLTSDLSEDAREARTRYLDRLNERGMLQVGPVALNEAGRPLRSVVQGVVLDGAMAVQGTARMLHVMGDDT